jgi:uncharacterized protein YebE (UPF0316 family)
MKLIPYLLAFLLMTTFISALTNEDRNLLIQNEQKLMNQVNTRIDSQTIQIEGMVEEKIKLQHDILAKELEQRIKNSLKNLGFGLMGIIVISLTLFKILNMQLSHNKNIKKYEKEIKEKTIELNQQLLQLKKLVEAKQEITSKPPKIKSINYKKIGLFVAIIGIGLIILFFALTQLVK